MSHDQPSPLAGRTVDVALRGVPTHDPQALTAALFTVVDWVDRLDDSWREMGRQPAATMFAHRVLAAGDATMLDDQVLAGRIAWDGHDGGPYLVHVSEVHEGEFIEPDALEGPS